MVIRADKTTLIPSKSRDIAGKPADPMLIGDPSSVPLTPGPSRYISPLRQKRLIKRYYVEDRGLMTPQGTVRCSK
jgi:hypothetical protein